MKTEPRRAASSGRPSRLTTAALVVLWAAGAGRATAAAVGAGSAGTIETPPAITLEPGLDARCLEQFTIIRSGIHKK